MFIFSRYYVVIDEREPPGETNWTLLTDKITAKALKIPYYVVGSFNRETLPTPRKFLLGDGEVYGGYLNYPLVPGKPVNWEFVTVWEIDGKPVVGHWRGKRISNDDGGLMPQHYFHVHLFSLSVTGGEMG